MSPEEPREAAAVSDSGASDSLPPQVGAARFRYVMTAIAALLGLGGFIWAVVAWGLASGLEPPETALIGGALFPSMVPVWFPSAFIARGLLAGRRWAVRAALIHDAVIVAACTGVLVSVLPAPREVLFDLKQMDPYVLGVCLLLGVLSATEGTCLLRAVRRGRHQAGSQSSP